jgi:hypothetical protein
LSASPSSGSAPLNNVNLTAIAGNTGLGYYYFYCDRSQSDTLPPVPISINTPVLIPIGVGVPYISPVQCNYSAPGTYRPKVISLWVFDLALNYVGQNWSQGWSPAVTVSTSVTPIFGVLVIAAGRTYLASATS